MDDNFSSQAVINNEFGCSNVVPTVETISYLVQYCDQAYKQFKSEYKEWNYKKSYGQSFEVFIRERNYNDPSMNKIEEQSVVQSQPSTTSFDSFDFDFDENIEWEDTTSIGESR